MPVCPKCKAEYRPGFDTCSDCRVPLVDFLEEPEEVEEPDQEAAPAQEVGWVGVYTGRARTVEMVEAYLRSMHIPFARRPAEADNMFIEAAYPQMGFYTVAVPEDMYERMRDEIDRAVTAGSLAGGDEDEQAMADAEEGFDVRACPACAFFFHDTYTACPGCGAELVPAVDVFEDGQLEADRVIVCDGEPADMDWLGGELRKAGFDAESFEVDDWPVAAVDLLWAELIDRTAEAEAIFVRQ